MIWIECWMLWRERGCKEGKRREEVGMEGDDRKMVRR